MAGAYTLRGRGLCAATGRVESQPRERHYCEPGRDSGRRRSWNETGARADRLGRPTKPPLRGPQEIVLYELHGATQRPGRGPPRGAAGTFRPHARGLDGMRHLRSLAEVADALHLMPSFDFATVPGTARMAPGGGTVAYRPNRSAAGGRDGLARTASTGLRQLHTPCPRAGYGHREAGPARIRESGDGQSLNRSGRAVMDVVTTTPGGRQASAPCSPHGPVLPQVNPYSGAWNEQRCTTGQRASEEGEDEPIRATWARGTGSTVPFDLMGHHMKRTDGPAAAARRAGRDATVRWAAKLIYGGAFESAGANTAVAQRAAVNRRHGIGTFSDGCATRRGAAAPFSASGAWLLRLWSDPTPQPGSREQRARLLT